MDLRHGYIRLDQKIDIINTIVIDEKNKKECRLRINTFVEHIFATCAALHNLRIRVNPWEYEN
jgi:hypothetical protein